MVTTMQFIESKRCYSVIFRPVDSKLWLSNSSVVLLFYLA